MTSPVEITRPLQSGCKNLHASSPSSELSTYAFELPKPPKVTPPLEVTKLLRSRCCRVRRNYPLGISHSYPPCTSAGNRAHEELSRNLWSEFGARRAQYCQLLAGPHTGWSKNVAKNIHHYVWLWKSVDLQMFANQQKSMHVKELAKWYAYSQLQQWILVISLKTDIV